MRRTFLVSLVLLSVVLATIPAPAAALEDPRFVTTVSEPRLTPGAEQVVSVHLENDAEEVDDRVETASNVRVEASSGETPFEIRSGPQKLGTIADGETGVADIRLAVPIDAPAGTYRIPLAVTYEYEGDERETTTVYADVRVPERPVFEVQNVSTTASIGERGSVVVTMTNNGSETAHDTRLGIESGNQALAIEGSQSATQYVGDWRPGANRTVEFDVGFAADASTREYAITLAPTYEDELGFVTSAPSQSIGVTPAAIQTFAIEDVGVTNYGDTITVTADLTNTGDRPVRNAQASISAASSTVRLTDATATVGTLEPGESTAITFELDMAPDAAAGLRQFDATVTYERSDDRPYQSRPVSFSADIPTETDVLELEPVNNTFDVDESNQLTVRVTNTGDRRVTDVHARLGVQLPYESDTRTAYVDSLEPGESALLHFEVTTPEDAVESTDALPITVNATGPDDRSISTGPTLVQIQVTTAESPTGSTTNLILAAVAVIAILVAGWWWLNQ